MVAASRALDDYHYYLRALADLISTGQDPGYRLPDVTRVPAGPRARKAMLNCVEATCILADVEQLAAKLKQRGVSNAVEQARDELAAKYGHASGEALDKWVRRTRSGAGQKRR
jgi:hypothetical protein